MTCRNCDPAFNTPGRLIKINYNAYGKICAECGKSIEDNTINYCTEWDVSEVKKMHELDYYREKLKRWDTYFHKVCLAISSKSPCLSRQIGAILVRDHSIVSTGYNGSPRGYCHCKTCIRKEKGYKSGEGLHLCPATHAEANCIANAARIGASTINSILYMNCILPCKDCMALLINAGVIEVVVDKVEPYHEMAINMADQANLKMRDFIL